MTENGTNQGAKPKVLRVDDDSMITAFYGAVLASTGQGMFNFNQCHPGVAEFCPCELVLLDI